MPTMAPLMPVTFMVAVAFFAAVSTMAMVSLPTRAATCAALAATDVARRATEGCGGGFQPDREIIGPLSSDRHLSLKSMPDHDSLTGSPMDVTDIGIIWSCRFGRDGLAQPIPMADLT